LYLRCLRIWAGETTSAQPKVASTLDNLANLYVNQGRYAEADSLYIRALEIWKESARDHHPLAAYAFSDYALSAQLQHDFVNASARARKAWNIRRSNFEDGGTVLAERAAYENAKFLVTETDNYLTVLTAGRAQLPERVSAVAGVVLSSKGIVTDVMAERYAIAVDEGGEAVQRIAEALREARFKLATLQLEEGASDASAYEDNLAATTKEKERLEVELARQSPTFQSKQQRWHVQTTDIADALPPNSVLVEYMRYEHRLSFREREARFIAVVLRKDREPDVVELGRADSIETAVKWYRSHFANFGAQIPADYDEISRDLYRLIWAPLDSLVRGHDAVFVAPDGELNLVAFAGLKRPDGRYLVEDFALHYLATGRDLIRLSYEPRGESFELLALGDPAFDATMEERCSESANPVNVDSSGKLGSAARRNARSGCEALQERNWSSLAATRAEVTQLVEIWATRGITSNVFTGAQASEERFKRESGGKRIIHLATHGFYVGEECRRKLSGNPSAVVKLGENPMLQSGFVLAGANLRKSWSDSTSLEDGIVTAEEVVGLDLHTTDLVVLSACETGLGDVKAGEGVFGLRRAFQLAGARTIISTLWPVEDQDAADLASGLLAAGYPLTIESVRAATLRQLWARRSAGLSDHPYYWAGFIVSGDWK
jgi:CHAT domain-containing protein